MTLPNADDPQDKLHAFITDPETIKQAVVGSMDKRLANMDTSNLLKILIDLVTRTQRLDGLPSKNIDEAIAAIEALLPEKKPEFGYMYDDDGKEHEIEYVGSQGWNKAIDQTHKNFKGQA